jgi:hypothetical protein
MPALISRFYRQVHERVLARHAANLRPSRSLAPQLPRKVCASLSTAQVAGAEKASRSTPCASSHGSRLTVAAQYNDAFRLARTVPEPEQSVLLW